MPGPAAPPAPPPPPPWCPDGRPAPPRSASPPGPPPLPASPVSPHPGDHPAGGGSQRRPHPPAGREGGREGKGLLQPPPGCTYRHLRSFSSSIPPDYPPPPPPQMMASLAGQRSTHAGTRGHALPPNKPRPAHGWKKPTATVQGEKNNPGSPGHNQSPAALPVPKLRHRASAWVPGSLQAAFRPFDPTKKKKKKEN